MKSITPVLCAVLLIGCEKKTAFLEKQMPAATPTPHVYKLGEPRPIVLNADKPVTAKAALAVTAYPDNSRRLPSNYIPMATPTVAGDSKRKAAIAKLQGDADDSKRAQEERDAQERSAWRTESQDAAWRARYGRERPPPDPKSGFRPTIADDK